MRSGPGTGYRKLDELHNGDSVRICHRSGNRIGVTCRSQGAERKGWVHGRWLRDGAG
ncbi:SH3 domain-containing protein [Pseudogemmobacter sonorensis]|uniref:SH3 domain-containing protein n=1 Tax=Pseudogemmobacter sonorensis TaxID=2989681 RepID=UPI0036CCD0B9